MAGSLSVSSPSTTVRPTPGERAAHRAGTRRLAGRRAGQLAGLGLAVAVADPETGRLVPGVQDLRVERLAGGDQALEGGERVQRRALGDHAVLRRRHAEDVDLLGVDDLQSLVRVEAGIVQERRGAPDPGRDERVAGRLRPAGGGRAPDELVRLRRQPVLGLEALAGQVALAVQDRLRLTGRAARERDQARIGGVQVRRRRGSVRCVIERHPQRVAGPAGEQVRVAAVGDDQARLGHLQAQVQILGAQLLGARQHDVALAEAREHRDRPLRAVSDQGEDDVASAYPARVKGSRERCRGVAAARRTSTRGASRRRPARPARGLVEVHYPPRRR